MRNWQQLLPGAAGHLPLVEEETRAQFPPRGGLSDFDLDDFDFDSSEG